MAKTMSVRLDRENYEFLHEIAKEEGVTCPRLFGTWLRAEEFCSLLRGTRTMRLRSAKPGN
jgi:predicted DNA-binding ribbon-helix-helix protein